MKTLFRSLTAVLVVLVGIVLFRTLTFSSRQVSAVEIDVLPLDEEALLERFARSLRPMPSNFWKESFATTPTRLPNPTHRMRRNRNGRCPWGG